MFLGTLPSNLGTLSAACGAFNTPLREICNLSPKLNDTELKKLTFPIIYINKALISQSVTQIFLSWVT